MSDLTVFHQDNASTAYDTSTKVGNFRFNSLLLYYAIARLFLTSWLSQKFLRQRRTPWVESLGTVFIIRMLLVYLLPILLIGVPVRSTRLF